MSRKRKKSAGFLNKCALLLKCILSASAFAALWIGIAISDHAIGVSLILIGAIISLFSVVSNIIVPIAKLK